MTTKPPPLFDRIPGPRKARTDVRCGTCAYWDRDAAKDAAGRVRGDRVAKCLWTIPASVPVPGDVSIRRDFVYRTKLDGAGCPAWVPFVVPPKQ